MRAELETASIAAAGFLCGWDVFGDAEWAGFVALGLICGWISYYAFARLWELYGDLFTEDAE